MFLSFQIFQLAVSNSALSIFILKTSRMLQRNYIDNLLVDLKNIEYERRTSLS